MSMHPAALNGHKHQTDGKEKESIPYPIRPDAHELSPEEKIDRIEAHMAAILETLGLDLTDDSVAGTPRRVAKMFVEEIFSGLLPDNEPAITLFENKFGYSQMLVERDIPLQSTCEHHLLPIIGRCHVAYISSGKVIGLSKLNRIVEYYARRPQIQERLTEQIAHALKHILDTEHVAVYIDADHMCVRLRGVEHDHSGTVTCSYHGRFLNPSVRQEFLQAIGR